MGMASRILGFGFAILMAFSAARADSAIILNGNFSDGKTHWHGAGDAPDSGGKLVITLKPDKWTVVRQNFSASASAVMLKINYSFSDDCTLGKNGDALAPPLTPTALDEACGLDNNIYNVTLDKSEVWTVVLVSGGSLISEYPVYSGKSGGVNGYYRTQNTTDANGNQTFTAQLKQWDAQFLSDDLCLCFPPGQGTVTLTDVEITPPGQ